MYRDAVEYKPGHWFAPGSEALELYREWKRNPGAIGTVHKPSPKQKLDALLKETDAAWRKLERRTKTAVNWS